MTTDIRCVSFADELQIAFAEAIADNEMMGRVFDSDDRLKAAMEEVRQQRQLADNAQRTLNAKNAEFVERAKSVQYWEKRARAAERQLEKLKVIK